MGVGMGAGRHATAEELAAGAEEIGRAPSDAGTVELIVARPAVDERVLLREAMFDPVDGLVGDNWRARGNSRTPDGAADPLAQVTIMNARAAALVAQSPERWALAGDQLYVDFDLGYENLPAGSRVQVGGAVLEVTPKPHTGCVKFSARFGADALRFVNSPVGRALRARGLNAAVVGGGTVKLGDTITKLLP